jgi:hypothetical protein
LPEFGIELTDGGGHPVGGWRELNLLDSTTRDGVA